MSQAYAVHLCNEALYTKQNIVYKAVGSLGDSITRWGWIHHPQTIDQRDTQLGAAYPTNIGIMSRCMRETAQNEGIHDLRGTNMIWARAILADKAQYRRYRYP